MSAEFSIVSPKLPALVTDVVGVVRSLGDVGIRSIVASEYPNSPNFWSRHCVRRVDVPDLRDKPESAVEKLIEAAKAYPEKPPILTGRESDVLLVSRHREQLGQHMRIKMATPELMETVSDKWRFWDLAAKLGIPTPQSFRPKDDAELRAILPELRFPCILKPLSQDLWLREEIYAIVGRWRKAFLVHDREELIRLFGELSKVGSEFLVQEYIAGGDQNIFEFHAYCPEPGKVAGHFLGRKIRTFPVQFGQGCYNRTWNDPAIARIGIETLEKTGYVGPTNVDLKQDAVTGRVVVLEINPRFSIWCHLASRSGVNLPHAMYNDCLGLPLPKLMQSPVERRWRYAYFDLQAFRQYRKTGEWTLVAWLLSLLFPRTVYFRWDPLDPLPLFRAFLNKLRQKFLG
jgi:predicted ATP-grasp superfamily ATP-dependent carboligase